MTSKNRYYGRSKISEAKFRQIVRCFALNFTAMSTAELAGISVRSVNSIYRKMRRRIAESCELESPLQGAVEVDESYFGAHRVRGKRGRGAYGKTIVFGLLKRQGKVYTEIVRTVTYTKYQARISETEIARRTQRVLFEPDYLDPHDLHAVLIKQLQSEHDARGFEYTEHELDLVLDLIWWPSLV